MELCENIEEEDELISNFIEDIHYNWSNGWK